MRPMRRKSILFIHKHSSLKQGASVTCGRVWLESYCVMTHELEVDCAWIVLDLFHCGGNHDLLLMLWNNNVL